MLQQMQQAAIYQQLAAQQLGGDAQQYALLQQHQQQQQGQQEDQGMTGRGHDLSASRRASSKHAALAGSCGVTGVLGHVVLAPRHAGQLLGMDFTGLSVTKLTTDSSQLCNGPA